MAAAAALAAALAGCGSSQPRSADDVARAWVRAVEAHDWERVCELSTRVPGDCPSVVAGSLGGWREPRVERVIGSGPGVPRAEITTADMRGQVPHEEGWTAYPPIELLLEPHDGGHLVHFEVAVIR